MSASPDAVSRPRSVRPAPHVAERRALRHLVLHELDDAQRLAASSWQPVPGDVTGPQRRPSRALVTGPDAIVTGILDVVRPLCDGAEAWDGRSARQAPDLLIGALPWRYEQLGDVPGLPGPLRGAAPAVLPVSFTDRTVTVGPIAGGAMSHGSDAEAGGPCIQCVHPAFAEAGGRPDDRVAPALFAFAAGACGLFVRAFSAPRSAATSMSLTFDIAAPHVEHRLWSCTPACRRAA